MVLVLKNDLIKAILCLYGLVILGLNCFFAYFILNWALHSLPIALFFFVIVSISFFIVFLLIGTSNGEKSAKVLK